MVGFDGSETLFASRNLNVVPPTEQFEKRLVFKISRTETRQIYIGQKSNVVENRLCIDQTNPLQLNATRLFFLFRKGEEKIGVPLFHEGRFDDFGFQIELLQRRRRSVNGENADVGGGNGDEASLSFMLFNIAAVYQ